MATHFRGMQVHAVPESERATDANGRKLPWAYEYADADGVHPRIPEERGPFGKPVQSKARSTTRRTTPAKSKEDKFKEENKKFEDDLFNSLKDKERKKAQTMAARDRRAAPPITNVAAPGVVESATAQNQHERTQPTNGEPTEVVLYGFPPQFQYAAIEFYERVSSGMIYEDYDRHPPNSKYSLSLTVGRAQMLPKLTNDALRKRNQYRGGDTWIKITFNSRNAAERACHYSPHTIHGYRIHAELYRGHPPTVPDLPIAATPQTTHLITQISPSNTISSSTAASGTATGVDLNPHPSPMDDVFMTDAPFELRERPTDPRPRPSTDPPAPPADSRRVKSKPAPKTRIEGAKRAVLRPASEALLPARSRWYRLAQRLPIMSSLVGKDLIGGEVPRLEDGGFDWGNASLYWKFWASVDWWVGTDFCGIKGDD
ncbi:hypothetical protein P152DRAFT_462314 [Eremomyces bilateralis CBS 781.70]|uniref:Uncharacterized protein n=1 Tax=Eremomyces bilateralis CBS 781.70 TaxID=1392243 RepID=A0A6G1FSC8_9PEZI|nr:uncharacterized protein P152DRAFT_462314 [Eremomyces bilateralis CBS 781.70]KAF1808591.1 hypothetical protein P152DRAFT_462314 [Eremomyces bilateralis CBS 781.70]